MAAENTRLDVLKRILERNPADTRALFGLAAEHEKIGAWEEVIAYLNRYLETANDQGNGWGRLGNALRKLGRDQEARVAYQSAADAARKHGHPSMAAEFEETLEEWDQV
jgi:E3 SUMO-protein ligase RanBP2